MNAPTLSFDVYTALSGLSRQTATIHGIPTGCDTIGILLTLNSPDARRNVTTDNKVFYILILRSIRESH